MWNLIRIKLWFCGWILIVAGLVLCTLCYELLRRYDDHASPLRLPPTRRFPQKEKGRYHILLLFGKDCINYLSCSHTSAVVRFKTHRFIFVRIAGYWNSGYTSIRHSIQRTPGVALSSICFIDRCVGAYDSSFHRKRLPPYYAGWNCCSYFVESFISSWGALFNPSSFSKAKQ